MLQQVTDQFGIAVDAHLDVMQPNQTLAGLTARLMTAIDGWLATTPVRTWRWCRATPRRCWWRRWPASTGAFRSVTSRPACAPATSGRRSPKRSNRRLATPLVTLHFAPTESARAALLREQVPATAIAVTGNTVIDALLMEIATQERDADVRRAVDRDLAALLGDGWATRPFVLITGHRRENFGQGFDEICAGIARLARGLSRPTASSTRCI